MTDLHALAALLGGDPTVVFTTVVEGNPVPKGRPRFSKQGHVYTPKETDVAEQGMAWCFKAAQSPRLAGEVVLVARFSCKNRRRRDVDNCLKLVMDAGTLAGLWGDDSQVTAQVALLDYDAQHPRTEIVWAPRRTA